jgi:hypothetical protein
VYGGTFQKQAIDGLDKKLGEQRKKELDEG